MLAEPGATGQTQLRGYLQVLWRRKWTVALVTILAVAAAIGFSESETPTYNAGAKVLLQTSVQPLLSTYAAPAPVVADEIQRLQSPAVAALVRKQLGAAPPVSGRALAGTDIMVVSASSTSAAQAARVANAYANAYIQARLSAVVASYLSAEKAIQGQIQSLQTQIATLNGQASASSASEAASLTSQVGLLRQQLSTLQAQSSLGAGGVQLLDPASAPTSPASPKKVRNGLLGLGGGLVLGIAIAFLRNSFDDTITTKEDLDREQPGLPVLGLIPTMPGRLSATAPVAAKHPHSSAAEAYRSLRTSVQFLALDEPVKIVQVTSSRTAEGKTTTVANLAVTLAAAGQKVIVVDCDLRRPRLHELFALQHKVGFTSVLKGDAPIPAALQPVPNRENLLLLPSGERPPNPAELLSSPRTGEILSALRRMADIVLVDCPPVLPVTDSVLISAQVDVILLVVSSGLTSAKDLSHALEVLAQVDAPVSGVVLNAIPVNAGYRYGYGYGYSPDPKHLRPAERT